MFFVSKSVNAIVYPVGQHIAIRDLFVRDDLRKNDIMFIYNDPDVIKMTSLNISKDNSLLLVCEKKEKCCCLSIYNLSNLSFNTVSIFKPKRKVISTIYTEFTYASFSWDGNSIATLGKIENESGSNVNLLQGVIWDVQIFQPFKIDNYKVQHIFICSPNAFSILHLESLR